MQIQRIPIQDINPAPYNPRKDLQPGDPDYERLARSLDEFGCVELLVWNRKTGNLISGHQRLKVLLKRGVIEIDASVVDLPLNKEKALNIALNKISGDWDERRLAELLDELVQLPEFDVGLTGFESPDAAVLIEEYLGDQRHGSLLEAFDVDAELNADRPIITRTGDLIELGSHRLLCGDCTRADEVRRLMAGDRAILFATDPPYLVNYDGTNHPTARHKKRPGKDKNKDWSSSYGITWDDAAANPDLYENFIRVAVDEAILPNAAWYCWHASRRQAMVEASWTKAGAFVHQQIVWVKDRPILNRSWFSWQHEPCFFGWVSPHKPPRRARNYPSTIWQIPTVRAGSKTDHPTSKPLEVFEIPMRQHTLPGEICYEPFAGSGSQLIAAERLGRRCFAVEISPRYCDVVIRRFIAYAGEKKVSSEIASRYRVTDCEEKTVRS